MNVKAIRIHKAVAKDIKKLNMDLKLRIAEALDLLAAGESIGLPLSRPMSDIANGVHELRMKDESGQYRIFYYTKVADSLLVFHFFKKKSQKTPKKELELAEKRLRSLL